MERMFPLSLFRALMSGSKETADRICDHDFSWLGVRKKFGSEIDWNFGAKQDIKIPWELSRFQFLPNICRAYEIHCNAQYALEAKELIRDWILKNPFGRGIHWEIPMEAAIRACNWITAWFFLKNSASWKDTRFEIIFLSSLQDHGAFIAKNLEYRKRGNTNHLIADFVGLFFLGVMFPEFRESKYWLEIAKNGLEASMHEQVYEDGVDYEASIPYHQLVCEFFGICALLAKENSIEFSAGFLNRLEKMFEFSAWYTKPNGLSPQIGDGDDGRLFILEDFFARNPSDHSHLFNLASTLFPLNKKFVRAEGAERQETERTEKGSRAFEKSGVFIMRKNDFYCIVDAGPNGQSGNGGHAHNDTLSFELAVFGEDFIIDPGTYCYTADSAMRKHFRSTRMHNTVMIDQKEMNRFRWFTLFSMKNDAVPKVNKWESNDKMDFLDAEHNGYERLWKPIIHRRTFQFNKENCSLEIKDFFARKGTHKKVAPFGRINEVASLRLGLEWNFHFAKGVMLRQAQHDKIIAEKNGKKLYLKFPKELHAEIREDFVSPSYGIKEKMKVLTLSYRGLCEPHFVFSIR